jgi:hypothetical protein
MDHFSKNGKMEKWKNGKMVVDLRQRREQKQIARESILSGLKHLEVTVNQS